jgi:hypothetical protein
MWEVATTACQYIDYARFCDDLHQSDKGRRYRQLAGIEDCILGENDRSHIHGHVGAETIHATVTLVVELFRALGLIKGELLFTDGQLRLDSRCQRLTITLSHLSVHEMSSEAKRRETVVSGCKGPSVHGRNLGTSAQSSYG